MTHKFLIIYRPEDPTDPSQMRWRTEEVMAETHEEAVREALKPGQIVSFEYEVHKVEETIHSDEFHHDGTFDDVTARLEDKFEKGLAQIEEPEDGWAPGSDMDRI